eukprot:scaffold1347_cov350-Pavlova_lutheri.AAC.33
MDAVFETRTIECSNCIGYPAQTRMCRNTGFMDGRNCTGAISGKALHRFKSEFVVPASRLVKASTTIHLRVFIPDS